MASDRKPRRRTPETIAAELDAPGRIVLFCIASGTSLAKAVFGKIVRGLIERAGSNFVTTEQRREVLTALLAKPDNGDDPIMPQLNPSRPSLILKRGSASRPSGERRDDDYGVLEDGVIVDRIWSPVRGAAAHVCCGLRLQASPLAAAGGFFFMPQAHSIARCARLTQRSTSWNARSFSAPMRSRG